MNKKGHPKQRQSRNMVIMECMELTGWSRAKVVASLKELEAANLIKFPTSGGVMLREEAL
ncbi:hypothetical protein [Streptococcus sanguinis]|mgnify:FL=1|uniref:hypothetical protein n=1 Tax=Streptococcus sanguinis TaxID=1305 RepID=UPI000F66C34A|nr:hypothetical protein [Streptococcus sanguinis]RSI35878.1 hypothetical protein D8876_04130 [Streptococcus sanguinis]